MKILSSPGKGICTEPLADEFSSKTSKTGSQMEMISFYDKAIGLCRRCRIICGLSVIFLLIACGREVSGNELSSGIAPDGDNSMYQIQIVVGNQNFPTILYKNDTTDALMNRLPMTVDMSDMNGNEKYYYLSDSLVTDSKRPLEIHAGDLMLYGTDCLVLFYESFSSSYSYTALGYVENAAGLACALGSEETQVSFMIE